MRVQLTDAHVRLLRGVRAAISADGWLSQWLEGGDGPSLVIEDFASEPWASLTFSGMRHRLDIRLAGLEAGVDDAHARLRELLREPELDLPGHFLAELQLVEHVGEIHTDGHKSLAVRIEALTIEE
jgi:hypothetical protein